MSAKGMRRERGGRERIQSKEKGKHTVDGTVFLFLFAIDVQLLLFATEF